MATWSDLGPFAERDRLLHLQRGDGFVYNLGHLESENQIMKWRVVVRAGGVLLLGAWVLPGCWTDPPPADCTGPVTVYVAVVDAVPVFSWRPDCTLGRLTVVQGPVEAPDEYWGTETCGTNTYDSPIRYGINPVGTCPEEPARPLERNLRYTVQVWRWYSVQPESLQLLGSADFDYAP